MKINTLTDKNGFDETAIKIDIKNIKTAVNELHEGLTTTQVVKDGSGSNITLTIVNGRITDIS